MSTEFFNDQWRIPSNENQNKVSNYSMEFDASSGDTIQLNNAGNSLFNNATAFTISAWINPLDTGTLQNILTNYGSAVARQNVMLRWNTTEALQFYVVTTSGVKILNTVNNLIQYNQWQHIVATYDGINSKIYYNGTLSNSLAATGVVATSTEQDQIGWRAPYGQYFNGKMDQVCVFDYALSQDQVTQLHNPGYAFNFNGGSQYINISNSPTFANDFTWSAWIYPKRVNNSYEMIYTQGTPYFAIRDTRLHVYITDSYETGLNFITANEWQHVAVTRTSGVLNLYRNGAEYNGTRPTQSGTINATNQGRIGVWYNSTHYFKGEMSSVQIFNTALPATGSDSIATLYNSGKPLADMSSFTSLQGWWKLDETATFNSNWSIPDDSTNSNTGTSVGMNASNLVASNINGELMANPMITSPKPIAYYQLGDQSVSTGPTSDYLVPNNSLSDYVFNFGGTNDYIDANVVNLPQGNSNFSVSCWFKRDSSNGNYGAIVSFGTSAQRQQFYLNFAAGGSDLKFGFYFEDYSTGLFATNSTDWYNAIVIFDNSIGTYGTAKLYVNGNLEKTFALTGTLNITGSSLNLGRVYPTSVGTNYYYTGLIGEVAVFNTELTSTQIETIYNNGAPNDISSLSPTAWYKLNAADTFDGNDWTINDYGSGGNDGTSSGMDSSNLVVSDLQQTSGYSPYALSLDGTDDLLDLSEIDSTGTKTYSSWIYPTVSGNNGSFLTLVNIDTDFVSIALWQSEIQVMVANSTIANNRKNTVQTISTNQWYHIAVIKSTGSVDNIYINGVNQTLTTAGGWNAANIPAQYKIGSASFPTTPFAFSGSISNVATWNAALTSTEITEIYNQGVPSNLNTFSGTAPIAWWQLGSNSSFNTNWTCLDEIGNNNAVSAGSMTNSDIVDGPGYSASGLGTSSIDIKGDAPYSTANGLSENMDVLDRTLDTPIRNTHSIQLDGVDDYIDFGNVNNFDRTDAFSGSCWVNLTGSDNEFILSKQNDTTAAVQKGYMFYVNVSRWLILYIASSSTNRILIRTNSTVANNTWNHLAFTYDGSSTSAGVKLYINGVNQSLTNLGNTSMTGSILSSIIPFQISGRNGNGASGINGKIDEVAMFNSELSATQVSSIYNNGTPSNILPLNPVSWHRFESLTTNGGVVTTADSSGNGLTGTVENGASLSTVVP